MQLALQPAAFLLRVVADGALSLLRDSCGLGASAASSRATAGSASGSGSNSGKAAVSPDLASLWAQLVALLAVGASGWSHLRVAPARVASSSKTHSALSGGAGGAIHPSSARSLGHEDEELLLPAPTPAASGAARGTSPAAVHEGGKPNASAASGRRSTSVGACRNVITTDWSPAAALHWLDASSAGSAASVVADAQVAEACGPLARFALALARRVLLGRLCTDALAHLSAAVDAVVADADVASSAASTAAVADGHGAGAAAASPDSPAVTLARRLSASLRQLLLAHCTAALAAYVHMDEGLARYREAASAFPDRGLLSSPPAGASSSSAAAAGGSPGAVAGKTGSSSYGGASNSSTGSDGKGALAAAVLASSSREWRALSVAATLDACRAIALGMRPALQLIALAEASETAEAAHAPPTVRRARDADADEAESGSGSESGHGRHDARHTAAGGQAALATPATANVLAQRWRGLLTRAVAVSEPLPRHMVRAALASLDA